MDDFLVVREFHDLGDLPHQVEALIHAEGVAPLSEEVIEPDRQGVVLEDEGGSQLVLGEAVDAEDTRVVECLEELKFAAARRVEVFLGRPRDDSDRMW